jgi:hypothetical protein
MNIFISKYLFCFSFLERNNNNRYRCLIMRNFELSVKWFFSIVVTGWLASFCVTSCGTPEGFPLVAIDKDCKSVWTPGTHLPQLYLNFDLVMRREFEGLGNACFLSKDIRASNDSQFSAFGVKVCACYSDNSPVIYSWEIFVCKGLVGLNPIDLC